MNSSNNNNRKRKRKLAYRARHRLLSIDRDTKDLKQRILSTLHNNTDDYKIQQHHQWPWLPNKNCGSWYLDPPSSDNTEVYFKSTDGHVGTYAISLKRLNIQLLELLHKFNGCFLIDSSVRKLLPDSFSRTIPIWCCVINRIVQRYRNEFGIKNNCSKDDDTWDTELYTPSSIISLEEHAQISSLIDSRVELLYQSKAIVGPQRLVDIMTKPVRAYWIASGSMQNDTNNSTSSSSTFDSDKYLTIMCCNPSFYATESHIKWINCSNDNNDDKDNDNNGYYYTPGAADDDSSWGRGLTHTLFWENKTKLLNLTLTDDEVDIRIDLIVDEWKNNNNNDGIDCNSTTNMDKIGDMNLWIGSRRCGRPPDCWNQFDAILNVTENEYPNMSQSIKEQKEVHNKPCYYLQLPVLEGKKDKKELERWLPVGLVFLIHHLQQNKSVLVHCAQGKDRSAAVVLALAALVCSPTYPLQLQANFDNIDIGTLQADLTDDDNLYLQSGLSQSLVDALLLDNGTELFLKWMHEQLNTPSSTPFANKESLRVVLHLVKQDREHAEPTRNTLQKLNRFFMSSPLYR